MLRKEEKKLQQGCLPLAWTSRREEKRKTVNSKWPNVTVRESLRLLWKCIGGNFCDPRLSFLTAQSDTEQQDQAWDQAGWPCTVHSPLHHSPLSEKCLLWLSQLNSGWLTSQQEQRLCINMHMTSFLLCLLLFYKLIKCNNYYYYISP